MIKNKDNLPFGKRYGCEPIEIPFQIDNMDSVLRIELWNAFYIFIFNYLEDDNYYAKESYKTTHRYLWIHYFKKAYDDFPSYDSDFSSFIRNYIEKSDWYRVYEFFEYLFSKIKGDQNYSYENFIEYVNVKMKDNNSAYTVVSGKFIPITNQVEIDEIKNVQDKATKYKLSGVQEHLNSALGLISKKPSPDLRNSIKESISMVETISRIIEPENSLGKALNKLEKNKRINKTLKEGFEKLYAYTNNKNGIRHALMDEKDVTIEDARFFLVSCSAFTNYLIEKATKENLLE